MSVYAVNGKEPIAAWIPSRDTSGNGTTTLTDLVGTNHGTLTNMDAETDWVADTDAGGIRALDFDGSNDRIEVSGSSSAESNLNLTGQMSVSAWIKPDSLSTVSQIVSRYQVGSIYNYLCEIGRTSGKASFVWAGVVVVASTVTIPTTSWTHVLWVREGTSGNWIGRIYINGVLDNSASTATNPVSTASATRIGMLNNATAHPYNGKTDDVRVFSQALDATDAAYLYNSGAGRGRLAPNYKYPTLHTGAVFGVYSPLDTGATAEDQFGSNDGTLTGGASRTADGYSFDGVNDYIVTNANFVKFDYSLGASFAAWIKPGTIAGGDTFSATNPRYILASTTSNLLESNALFRLLGGKINFLFRNSANTSYCECVSNSAVVTAGVWNHVGAVHTGSGIKLYHNGSEIASTTTGFASAARTVASLFYVGQQGTNARYFDGIIDDVFACQRALTGTEFGYLASQRGAAYALASTVSPRRRRDQENERVARY